MAMVPDVTAARLVPTAIGVMNAGSVVGGSALPWLAGAIGQGAGAWTLLPFSLALALVTMAIWWLMVPRRTEHRHSDAVSDVSRHHKRAGEGN